MVLCFTGSGVRDDLLVFWVGGWYDIVLARLGWWCWLGWRCVFASGFLGGCFGLDLPLGFGVAVSLGWVGCCNVVGLDLWLLLSCIGAFGFGLSFRCGLIAGC